MFTKLWVIYYKWKNNKTHRISASLNVDIKADTAEYARNKFYQWFYKTHDKKDAIVDYEIRLVK